MPMHCYFGHYGYFFCLLDIVLLALTAIVQKYSFTDIWREFIGKDIDLHHQSVVNWVITSMVNSEQIELLVDGNLATCLTLNDTSCNALKV